MDLCLKNKNILVSGASDGIGLEILKTFVHEGANVIGVGRNKKKFEKLKEKFASPETDFDYLEADVKEFSDCQRIANYVLEKYGNLNILVNNLGGASKYGSFQDLKQADWQTSFELNLLTMVNLTKVFEKQLIATTGNTILNISSIVGHQPGFFNPHYSAMKAATINLSKHLANIYASKELRVNVICPGPVKTASWGENIKFQADKLNENFEKMSEIVDEKESVKIPLARVGKTSYIATLAVTLCSEKCGWLTGTCINIDGGKTRGII